MFDSTGLLTDTVESFLVSNLINIDADYRRYFSRLMQMIILPLRHNWRKSLDGEYKNEFRSLCGYRICSIGRHNVGRFNLSVRMPLGFGMDWTVRGRFWWYFEAKIEVPFTQVNNEYIGNDFGVSYHFTTGARFLLHEFYR